MCAGTPACDPPPPPHVLVEEREGGTGAHLNDTSYWDFVGIQGVSLETRQGGAKARGGGVLSFSPCLLLITPD